VRRIAAIDIGSNSVRSIVVEVPASGGPTRLLHDEKVQTRLAAGLSRTDTLAPEAMDRTIEALGRMLEMVRSADVEKTRAVATSAVREAVNGKVFVARVKRELGLAVEIVSAEDEGRLAFLSAAAHFDLAGRVAVMDLGGGSLEVVRAVGGEVEAIDSLALGAVALTERFATEDPVPPKSFKTLKRHVRASLADAFGPDPDAPRLMVGSGGTVNSLAWMSSHLHGESFNSVQGYAVSRADVVHLVALLKRSTVHERRSIAGLAPQRADIILAGAVVVDEIMRLFGANEIRVNAKGIREGLVQDTISARKSARSPRSRMRAVMDFARRCRFDRKHSLHVAELALSLFDQLADKLGLADDGRPLLEAAAVLHDVGYYIAYDRHHKHSYHLVRHADLPGFTPREREMIASLARYHRGALPRAQHESLRRLAAADREQVERLGALLRLADGLDRSRGQKVRRVTAEVTKKRLVLRLEGDIGLDIEVYGAIGKGDLLQRAFGLTVEVNTDGAS
jgi:exopolyphosphatase/guanosine-5'-triphosphate,3'-diphosphate pyrophosphatase